MSTVRLGCRSGSHIGCFSPPSCNDDGSLVSCWECPQSDWGVGRGAILDVSLLPPVMMMGRYSILLGVSTVRLGCRSGSHIGCFSPPSCNDDGPLVSCWECPQSDWGVGRGAILDVSLLPPVMMMGR